MSGPPKEVEGAGNAGCLLHPRSRAQKMRKDAHTSIQVQTEQSGIPCAMVLRLIPRSPRRRIRLVTVADGLKVCLNPVGSTLLRQLDTSNGCQNHTAFPYAAPPVVCALCSLTTQAPPCQHHHAPDAAASTASRPNVRDDGQRPSTGTGWGSFIADLGWRRSGIFLLAGLDGANHVDLVAKIRLSAQSDCGQI